MPDDTAAKHLTCIDTWPHGRKGTDMNDTSREHDWIDDGHTARVVLVDATLVARVDCPHEGGDHTATPLDALPACRVGRDDYGRRFALGRCLLTATAEEFQNDELWQGDEQAVPIDALPVPLLWRDNGTGEVYLAPKSAEDPGGEPVHEWFGLTYSSYQVLPRVLMQSMPVAWQRQMVGLLEQLRDAFSHLEQAGAYDVQAAIEVEAGELTPAQMKATGVTREEDEENDETVYRDAEGDELRYDSRVLVRVAEPLPPYNRGRTRIPTRTDAQAHSEAPSAVTA